MKELHISSFKGDLLFTYPIDNLEWYVKDQLIIVTKFCNKKLERKTIFIGSTNEFYLLVR